MENNNEIWKDIPGLEGKYQASNLGNIKSLNYGHHVGKVKILRPQLSIHGYYIIDLNYDYKHHNCSVHRLVAKTFLPNPDNLPQVNHKDENKLNNTVWINDDGTVNVELSNLEWCSRSYNCLFGNRNKKILNSRKELNRNNAERPVGQYKNGVLIMSYKSIADAGRNGFSHSAIINCCQGKRKTHLGYGWAYLN